MNDLAMEESDRDTSVASDLVLTSSDAILDHRGIVEDLTGEDVLLGSTSSVTSIVLSDETPKIKPRAYQLEMLEQSVEKNIIVAMDTGSGKTHIATLRMIHELEQMDTEQRIWVLAPTVDLCAQQFDYINSQISAVQIRFLSGSDGVDRWTEQTHWDSILQNMKIVVSTYQILLDALTHGFVRIEALSLIVFDEAHHCVGKHPGAKIMQNFYHPRKSQVLDIPHILGLTASPVMRSNLQSLVKIEETLDAICRTPTQHRAELRLQVKLPVLSQQVYEPNLLTALSKTVRSLSKVVSALTLKITEDPYVLSLLKDGSEKSIEKAEKVCFSRKTWCQGQMKTFIATTIKIAIELGSSAADYYVLEIISRYVTVAETENELPAAWDVSSAERHYLAAALKEVEVTHITDNEHVQFSLMSDKVEKLIDILTQEPLGFSGIVFVQERAVVAVLSVLLSNHPSTRGRFRIGTIVGTSSSVNRPFNIGELADIKSQKDNLSLFKAGIINLMIATSILEEGIDVPACNLVICFQKPANLKSFVQQRGRARHQDSKLILLLDSLENKVSEWQKLELDMKKLYEDEMRSLQAVLLVEDAETNSGQTFRVESTNALLEFDNALQHLYHFCATLPRADYVDPRPEFICYATGSKLVRAKVILPLSVHETVRFAESRSEWMSERIAIKDAAFEAYLALHRAGLVNDNLLPLLRHDPIVDDLLSTAVETRASLMIVNEQLNPWIDIAKLWRASGNIQKSTVTCDNLKMSLFLPKPHHIRPFKIHWDSKTEFPISIENCSETTSISELSGAANNTWSILATAFGSRFQIQRQKHVSLFSPSALVPLTDMMGRKVYSACEPSGRTGLVRDMSFLNIPYILQDSLEAKPPKELVQQPYEDYDKSPPEMPHLSLKRLPRRLDFLHEIPPGNGPTSMKLYATVLPTSRCIMDDMPFEYVRFGLLIPSIMRRLEISLLADMLSTTLLKSVDIGDMDLIATAISASSARESSNYQRLEFIGDSVLKMCTSIQLMGEYPLWHEAYLSSMKDRLIANSRLSRAAIESGLDKFIITKSFTGHKWRPLYVDDLLQLPIEGTREMSSKVLADVVEALIGAAMVDGGVSKALQCLQLFLPELEWQPLENRRLFLYNRVPDAVLPITLQPLEQLIGYQFQKKALLIEAMTHASCNIGTGSYERLEFLGDSILDRIVVGALEQQDVELTHVQMHLFRTALVNADFLAFLCMESAVEQERTDLVATSQNTPTLSERTSIVSLPLWRFIRHHSPKLGAVQIETSKRYAELRDEINGAIGSGSHYPWALLARLQALKFYSDIVESLLGAVWIDCGSFDVCRTIVERMGILPYLRRMVADGVHLWHPKEELGRLADAETVRYSVGVVKGDLEDGEKRYWCRVFVGEREVVVVEDGVAKDEVMTRAAGLAVRVLKGGKGVGEDVDEMDLDKEKQGDDMVLDA